MFGSTVLEVGIGLTFMFLLVSLLCSAMREMIEAALKSRATDLEKGIIEILGARNNPNELVKFYNHPLISCLYRDGYRPDPKFAGEAAKQPVAQGTDGQGPVEGAAVQAPAVVEKPPVQASSAQPGVFDLAQSWIAGLWPAFKRRQNLPTYIPSANFAVAALSLLAPTGTDGNAAPGVLSVASLREAAAKIENKQLQTMLLTALDGAQDDIDVARKNLETWYNSSMDRVSGIYKRRTQLITFGLGLFAAGLFNIDAIRVANHLATDQTYREAIVKDAATFLKAPDAYGQAADSETLKERLDTVRTQVEQSGFAIGWACTPIDKCISADDDPKDPVKEAAVNRPFNGLSTFGGWLVTALAVSLGAPFWFDVLNKFMVVRSTVKPAEKSGQEASKDSSGERVLKAGDSVPVNLVVQQQPRGDAGMQGS